MALKVLKLRKSIDLKKKELNALRAKDAEFATREAELEAAINEAESEEDMATVDEEMDSFQKEKEEHEAAKGDLEREVGELEDELAAEERQQDTVPPVEKKVEEREAKPMATAETRNRFGLTDEMIQREGVQDFLVRVRDHISHKRALTNVGLTIPTEFLGILRENVINYSKLYRHVNVRYLSGEGRMVVMGTIPEAVWTECCATLNELSLGFNDVEVDCNKLGGYFAICNAILEDSDISLATELLTALSQAIGYALDKAILYGTGTKMPLGVVSRLAQTEAPSDYPATARPWADLHTTNIKSIAAATKGVDLFREFILDSGAAKGAYARGEKVWVMNETTYTTLIANAMVIDAAGSIVAGVNGSMPVVGGVIEVLNFIPDNVIIGGYFELYLLAERASTQLAQSEHVRFIEDQTVFKGTARYDGLPVIAEAFVAIGLNGTTPNATMTFAPDTANSGEG